MTMVDSPAAEPGASLDVIAPVPRIAIHAFCESQSLIALIQSAAQDRRMDKAAVKTNAGGVQAALAAYREEQTPNVIVLEAAADRDPFLASLDALANYCDDGTRVVVVGRANDISLYRALIARGVSEYLVEPFDLLDFIRAISELYAKPGKGVLGRIVAVYGARGGVGASTVAHHTAWSIATKVEMSTVIADCDLPFGTAGLDFNQDPPQGIGDAVFAPDRLDINMLDRLMTKCNDRLVLLPAPATLERNYDFDATAFEGIIDLLRSSAPMIVLDLPHVKDFSSSINLAPSVVIPFDPKLFGAAANNGQMAAEVSGGAKIGQLFENFGRLVCGKPELRKAKTGLLGSLKSPKLGFSLGKKA